MARSTKAGINAHLNFASSHWLHACFFLKQTGITVPLFSSLFTWFMYVFFSVSHTWDSTLLCSAAEIKWAFYQLLFSNALASPEMPKACHHVDWKKGLEGEKKRRLFSIRKQPEIEQDCHAVKGMGRGFTGNKTEIGEMTISVLILPTEWRTCTNILPDCKQLTCGIQLHADAIMKNWHSFYSICCLTLF